MRGFSLVELMVVIGVIAIINLVMVPSFTSLQRSAKQLSAKSSARQLMIGLEQYQFMHNAYPEGTAVPMASVVEVLIQNGIIQSPPVNPYTGQLYRVNDSSGQIEYSKEASDQYRINGYGQDNQELIFSLP